MSEQKRLTLQDHARHSINRFLSEQEDNPDVDLTTYVSTFSKLFQKLINENRLDICQASAGALLFHLCQLQLTAIIMKREGLEGDEHFQGWFSVFTLAGEKAMADTTLNCS